jgi:hypothetical protein
MLLAWKQAKVITCGGYIIGFPHDTPASIQHDITVIQRELPIDLLEFFVLTPLPGSEDHKKLYERGVWMDPDMNKYDATHVTTAHPMMSRTAWEAAYEQAWTAYYSPAHMRRVMVRAKATGSSVGKTLFLLLWFKGCHEIEKVHPLEGGILRLKSRAERRPGLPHHTAVAFYTRFAAETAVKALRWGALWIRYGLMSRAIKLNPGLASYQDASLVMDEGEDERQDLELFGTEAARTYIARRRKLAAARAETAA